MLETCQRSNYCKNLLITPLKVRRMQLSGTHKFSLHNLKQYILSYGKHLKLFHYGMIELNYSNSYLFHPNFYTLFGSSLLSLQ